MSQCYTGKYIYIIYKEHSTCLHQCVFWVLVAYGYAINQ